MSAKQPPRLSLIGAGRLGRVLARLWQEAEVFSVHQVLTRSLETATEAVEAIGAGVPCQGYDELLPSEYFCLCAPDAVLADVAVALKESDVLRKGDAVFHCSGVQSAACLSVLNSCEVRIASMHPAMSFAKESAASISLKDCCCALDGDATLVSQLASAVQGIGAQPIPIASEVKPLYHLAMVFSSNFLQTLMSISHGLLATAGFSEAQASKLLTPLLRGSLENALQYGPARALTGPIQRGDSETIALHLAAMNLQAPQLIELYQKLSLETLALAEVTEMVPARREALVKLLTEEAEVR